MSDYPDYTTLMQIIGSDIMVPIDVQGAYIMMPVDIQAQYITLDIDIVAQTVGNIAIDLAAQSIGNIEVDIKAQTVGDITIDIDAQSVGVYLQPEWTALQGTDKNLFGSGSVNATTWDSLIDYTVTAGKTFYATQFGVTIEAQGAGVHGYIRVGATDILCAVGGIQGASQTLAKPVVVSAGVHIFGRVLNCSAGASTIRCTIQGYEI